MWESPKHINLLTEESFNYNLVRMAIPKSYEFVPEAYQQKFKNHIKIRSYWIYVEFLKQKEIYFNWRNKVKNVDNEYEKLRQLLLVEGVQELYSRGS